MNAASFKAYREICGITQQQAADSCGVALVTVKKWERGERSIPADAASWLIGRYGDHVALTDDIVSRSADLPEGSRVAVGYYRNQEQADLERPDGAERLPYQFCNAASRSAAEALADMGMVVSFAYPDEERIYAERR